MIEGMYGIEFKSNLNDSGYGVVIFETGRIFGGDSSCVYIGNYKINHDRVLEANIEVTNDRKTLVSIFGDIEKFHLRGRVKLSNDDFLISEFTMHGEMVENPAMKIEVLFTRRANLP